MKRYTTTGAGRTDTGVHASFFCAHFDSISPDLAYKEKPGIQAKQVSSRRYFSKFNQKSIS